MQTDLPADLLEELGLFTRRADEIAGKYGEKIAAREIPELIYHYTNDDGLQGILESGQLWLTDILKLNDPSEIKFGIDHEVSVLNREAAHANKGAVDFAELFSATLQSNLQRIAKFYSLSFSREGDDLGQWRAYADDGKGYVLAFDGKAIEKAFTLRDGNRVISASTFPITYNQCGIGDRNSCNLECELSKLHRDIVGLALPLLSEKRMGLMAGDLRVEYLKKLSVALASSAFHIATFFKHFAYRHEQEYRFLQMTGAGCNVQLNVRRRPNQIVEYAKFDWRRSAPRSLRKIIVGPAADKPRARRFAEDCVRLYCGHSVGIQHSIIPYRSA